MPWLILLKYCKFIAYDAFSEWKLNLIYNTFILYEPFLKNKILRFIWTYNSGKNYVYIYMIYNFVFTNKMQSEISLKIC